MGGGGGGRGGQGGSVGDGGGGRWFLLLFSFAAVFSCLFLFVHTLHCKTRRCLVCIPCIE